MKRGFTLSEVLLTIAIIGIVAAITLPPLLKHIKTNEYSTARKRMLNIFSNVTGVISTENGSLRDAEDAEDFVNNYLKHKIGILKVCDNEHLRECGIETKANKIYSYGSAAITMPISWTDMASNWGGASVAINGGKSYGFVMNNGYSVNLFYNPECDTTANVLNARKAIQYAVCINIIYDINGLSGPNQSGMDIGTVTIIDPVRPDTGAPEIVAVSANCSNKQGYGYPSIAEATSIAFNNRLYEQFDGRTINKGYTNYIMPDDGTHLSIAVNGRTDHRPNDKNSFCVASN